MVGEVRGGCANVRPEPVRSGELATDRTPRRGTLCVEAGLLARGSLRLSGLPRAHPSGTDGLPLTAYSCGGSSGFTPASLLAPRQISNTENLVGPRMAASGVRCQVRHKHFFI
jgi:hypothetical protein